MKSLAFVAAAALAATQLAACGQRSDPGEKRADASKPTVLADTSRAQSADTPRQADPFKSAVSGRPAPGSPQAADAELSSKVKSALTSAPEIKTGGLEVASANGVVTLYGTVDAPVEKDRAAMLAMEVEGVRSVVNNLVVVKGS